MKIAIGKPTERGSALLVTLAILMMLTILGLQMVDTSTDEMKMSGNMQDATKAFYSAEAGLALAKSKLWSEYVNWACTDPVKKAGDIGSRLTYTTYLNQLGLPDLGSMNVVQGYHVDQNQRVDSVVVKRQDQVGAVVLTVASTGSFSGGSRQTIRTVYRVEGELFKGFDFAILAKNVNCIMCHANIDNVDRVYNTDNSKKGTFDRVKVASLESMLLRTTSALSQIAGTLYTRGVVTDKAGNLITDLSPTGKGLGGYEINSADGKINEPLKAVALANTTGSPLPQYGNLYMNYPTAKADMTDGALPDKFPPPFPDDNGNKVVDNDEYLNVANSANGSVSGGVIYTVSTGSTYTGAGLPGTGNSSGISKSYDGNLILVGTDANPIVISGTLAVGGDVIIQGKVQGTGQIIARGSVYVTGDLTYADGTDKTGQRTYGKAADGTGNTLSLAAGKDILVGDYLTQSGGNILDMTAIDPGNQSGGQSMSFTMSEITLFNRGEWTKTQAFLPNASGTMVANSTYDASYVPRYYTMNEGDPVYIFNMNSGGKGTYWDAASNSWMGKEHIDKYDTTLVTKLDAGSPKLAGAKTLALSSGNNWISPQTLKSIWIADETQRKVGNEFRIDGQLYTNNSIFTLTRSASKTGGKMTMNGAMVAADVGVLVANGLDLRYDQRLKSFLKIKDDSNVGMATVAWYAE